MLLRDKNFECQIEQTTLVFIRVAWYQSSTFYVFFRWLISVDLTTFLLMVSRIALLILPIFDFGGFIKRHGILCGNSSLWSLIVIYALVSYISSALSAIDNFSATLLAAKLMSLNFFPFDVLYVLVMLSRNKFLYLSSFIL